LVIEWPIGHGKSEWFSFIFVLWYIFIHPNNRIIMAFGNEQLRKRFANLLMDAIRRWGFLFNPKMDIHKRFCSIECFRLAEPYSGEVYLTLPNSGAIQGMRGHLIICDDLVPTIQMAASQKERETIIEWFQGVLCNRTMPEGTKMIVVMSRRHPLDLSGAIQESQKSMAESMKWRTSTLEAICTDKDKDPLHREVGEALWPAKWPVNKLMDIRQDFEDRGQLYLFESQYQQNAMSNPAYMEFSTKYFEDIWYDELPPNLPIKATCMALDPSKGKDSKTGDYSALVLGHLDNEGCIWIEQSFLERATIPMIVDKCVNYMKAYKPHAFGIECNGFQEEVAQRIAEEALRQEIVNIPVLKITNTLSKTGGNSRILITLDPIFHQCRLKFRRTPTNERGIMQVKTFPSGEHDDFPDALELLVQTFIRVLN
jgi:hypothetical protein